MTRILVQRGSTGGSSSNPSRSSSLPASSSSSSSSSSARPEPQITTTTTSPQVLSAVKDEDIGEEAQENVVVDELLEYHGSSDNKAVKSDDLLIESIDIDRNESSSDEIGKSEKFGNDDNVGSGELIEGLGGLRISESVENEGSSGDSSQIGVGTVHPPPPPIPPPKPSAANTNSRRSLSGSSNAVRIGSSRRAVAWPVVSTRTSPTGSRPSSPRSHGENEGYNSADEQNPCFVSSYDDLVSF